MATATVKNHKGDVLSVTDMPDTPIMAMAVLLRAGYQLVSATEGNEITLVNMGHGESRFVIFKD